MGTVEITHRLMTPRNVLRVSTFAASVGALFYAVLVMSGRAGNLLYFWFILSVVLAGPISLYILKRARSELALEVYAWWAGMAFAGMIVSDADAGKRWFPAFCVLFYFGIAVLVILVNFRQAKRYTIFVSAVALAAGWIDEPNTAFFSAVGAWGILALVSYLVDMCHQAEDARERERTARKVAEGETGELRGHIENWKEILEAHCGAGGPRSTS